MAEPLKGSVLLVDDDPAVAKVLGALLVQAGLTVHTAKSGAEALALLGHKPIDVVVSDVRMPGMSGLELLGGGDARVCPEVPIVLMTAHGTVPMAVEAMKAGARTSSSSRSTGRRSSSPAQGAAGARAGRRGARAAPLKASTFVGKQRGDGARWRRC